MPLCVLPVPWSGSIFAQAFWRSRHVPRQVQAVGMAMRADGCSGPSHCSEILGGTSTLLSCAAGEPRASVGKWHVPHPVLSLQLVMLEDEAKSHPWRDSTFPGEEGFKPSEESWGQPAGCH